MPIIPVTNFGKVTVSQGYDAAATSIVLSAGHGAKLPSTFPFPLVWWNATDYSDPADDPNVEIVSVTARATDTLTVTRAQEGTAGTVKNLGSKTYKMILTFTKALYDGLSVLNVKQGTFTRDVSVASGTTTFAHGGGVAPKAVLFFGSSGLAAASWGAGLIGGAVGMVYTRLDDVNKRETTSAAVGYFVDASNFQYASPSSADGTNVTMTWSKTGAPTGTLSVHWTAFF